MPGFFTHYIAGQKVYEALPANVKECIDKRKSVAQILRERHAMRMDNHAAGNAVIVLAAVITVAVSGTEGAIR